MIVVASREVRRGFYVWLSGWFSFVTWLLFVSRVSRGVFIYLYLRGA